jgi:T4 RnlA family RNA ligase
MYKVPTYQEAVSLTIGKRYVAGIDQYLDAAFYEAKFVLDGYNVSVFNYRLADYKDFNENDAFEIRGLVYVFDHDGSYKTYRLLHKFFNLNQVDETQYSNVKNRKVKSVYSKEDGSVGSFIKLPNGKVIAKSKMSFESDQALGMMSIYQSNQEIKEFVNWSLDNDLVAVFEYVAPHNRIVLRYTNEELILLRLRDNSTGEYLDLDNYKDKIGDIKTAVKYDYTLDELVDMCKYVEDMEGWVVDLDGLFVKMKTAWYFSLHGLLTNDLYRENKLIGYILDEQIDDVISQIPEDDKESNTRVENIVSVVKQAVADKSVDILKSYDLFLEGGVGKDWEGEFRLQLMRKTFAINYRKDPNFGYVMSLSKGADVYDLAKDWVSGQTKKLKIAREFLQNRDSSFSFSDIEDDE